MGLTITKPANYNQRKADIDKKLLIAKMLQNNVEESTPDPNQIVSGRVVPINPIANVLNGLTNSYANYQANKATDEQAQFDDERRNNLMHALAGGKPLTAEALAQIGASYDDILNLENHRNSRVPMPSPSYVPANFKPFKEGNFDGYIDESGNRIRNPFAMTEAQRNLYDPELQGKISLERNKNKIGPVVGEDDATRIMKYGEAAGFEPALDATARVESGNNPNAVSPAGARGTYQIMDETADDPGYGLKPLSPNATEEQKRLFAAEYQLNMLKAHPDWTYGHVVSAYNMGPGNVEKGRRNPDYEKKIMGGVRSPTMQEKNAAKTQQALTQKQGEANIENEQKTKQTQQKKEQSAENMLKITSEPYQGKTIEQWIDEATGSGIGASVDSAARFFGNSTKGAQAQKVLETIQGWLVSNVPRMEGPQSDFDVRNYQQMASDISNPNITREEKLKSFQTMRALMQKYVNQPQQGLQYQQGLQPGTVEEGHVYIGGDPSKPENWKLQ